MSVAAVDPPERRRLPVLGRPPRTRGDCLPAGSNAARPCRYLNCRYHLAVEGLRGRSPSTGATCALDEADRAGLTLDEVGHALGVTRERVRQVEVAALAHVAAKLAELELVSAADAQTAVAAARRLLGRHARF